MSDTLLLNNFIRNARTAGAEVLFSHEEAAVPTHRWENLLDFTLPEIAGQYQPEDYDPEDWYDLPAMLFRGHFGVAETGAIWLDDDDLPHRILPFITPHLILKLNSNDMVADMREAYNRLSTEVFGFGVFICWPSKTEDIEQSLVYGAHGAKTLTIVLFD